jgi:hypothetical protein
MRHFRLGLTLVAMMTQWLGSATIQDSLSIAKVAFFLVYAGFFILLAFELFRRRRPSP